MPEFATISTNYEIYLRNMRFLWRHDPELALQIDAVHDAEWFPVERARSGAWTAKIETAGSAVYLHSRIDPESEARRWADGVELQDKYCFVVSGFGLGYHLAALFDRLHGDAFILCVEPSVRLIATALAHTDLSAPLEANRLVILTDADKGRLHQKLQNLSTLMMLGAQFVRHAPSVRLDPQAHAAIQSAINDFVTYSHMSLMTLVSNARITCKNIAMNLTHYVSTPPIDILKDRFAGNPAIVISAGPSLSRNIEKLAALKGRAVLCAVQTALRPLMQRGIVPDFVTSLDFHEISQRFFENVGDLSRTHLVAEPKASWHVIDRYGREQRPIEKGSAGGTAQPGTAAAAPVSLLDNSWARLVLGDPLGARGGLPAGATVAHLAFYLAVYLGCDPIIFVGQDLAFTGHVFYVPGVEIHRAWRSEINRFNSIEQKEWERIVRNRPILRKVKGNDDQPLYTDDLLLTYLEQFEKDIAAVDCDKDPLKPDATGGVAPLSPALPGRVINATEGGARIRGATPMTLNLAAKQYCREQIDPKRFAYRESTGWRDESRLSEAAKLVGERIDELDGVVALCDELLTLLQELDGLTHDPARFNKKLVRVDELRTKVQQNSRAYRIVNAACQLVEFRRFSADRKIAGHSQSAAKLSGQAGAKRAMPADAARAADAQRAKRQIARDIEFITGVRDGARDVRPILIEAADRLRNPPWKV